MKKLSVLHTKLQPEVRVHTSVCDCVCLFACVYVCVCTYVFRHKICLSFDIFNYIPLGFIDDIIEPSTTRRHICEDLKLLQNKRQHTHWKKHGNIPL